MKDRREFLHALPIQTPPVPSGVNELLATWTKEKHLPELLREGVANSLAKGIITEKEGQLTSTVTPEYTPQSRETAWNYGRRNFGRD